MSLRQGSTQTLPFEKKLQSKGERCSQSRLLCRRIPSTDRPRPRQNGCGGCKVIWGARSFVLGYMLSVGRKRHLVYIAMGWGKAVFLTFWVFSFYLFTQIMSQTKLWHMMLKVGKASLHNNPNGGNPLRPTRNHKLDLNFQNRFCFILLVG